MRLKRKPGRRQRMKDEKSLEVIVLIEGKTRKKLGLSTGFLLGVDNI